MLRVSAVGSASGNVQNVHGASARSLKFPAPRLGARNRAHVLMEDVVTRSALDATPILQRCARATDCVACSDVIVRNGRIVTPHRALLVAWFEKLVDVQ
jgi:hypothetical protein